MPRGVLNPIDKHVGGRVRMRRLMLDMSQTDLADALGLTFQQVQKYEKGTNRIGASRLQHISQILQAPVPFFFEGVTEASGVAPMAQGTAEAPAPSCATATRVTDSYVTDFFATSDGLFLMKAFMRIADPKLRRSIVRLVQEITPEPA
jgi:transcriptional regulator with XRE-family HTH domain